MDGDHCCFIEIVDTPDQSTLIVPPGTKIFDVDVTNREHRRRLRVLRKQCLDPLRPSKEGRAEEDECINGHLIVLIFEICFNNLASNMSALLAQPVLECGTIILERHERLCPAKC